MKYGMKYRTIRYFQNQAAMLVRLNGVYMRPDTTHLATLPAREIAHRIIGAAFVHTPDDIRAMLQHTTA